MDFQNLLQLIDEQKKWANIEIDMLKKKSNSYFVNIDNTIINFIVVGCGGSGGYFIRDFARYIKNNKNLKCTIMLVDGDTVEEKNLVRQNFIDKDLGKHKAEVLANRYSRAYGIDILYHNDFIRSEEDVHKIIDTMNRYNNSKYENIFGYDFVNFIVGFTDSVPTRKILSDTVAYKKINVDDDEELKDIISNKIKKDISTIYLANKNNFIYVDMGNMDYYGQAAVTFSVTRSSSRVLCSLHLFDLLPGLRNESAETEVSCAERAIEVPQTIFANVTSATLAMNIVCSIFYKAKIEDKIVYFNCLDLILQPVKYMHEDVLDLSELSLPIIDDQELKKYIEDNYTDLNIRDIYYIKE